MSIKNKDNNREKFFNIYKKGFNTPVKGLILLNLFIIEKKEGYNHGLTLKQFNKTIFYENNIIQNSLIYLIGKKLVFRNKIRKLNKTTKKMFEIYEYCISGLGKKGILTMLEKYSPEVLKIINSNEYNFNLKPLNIKEIAWNLYSFVKEGISLSQNYELKKDKDYLKQTEYSDIYSEFLYLQEKLRLYRAEGHKKAFLYSLKREFLNFEKKHKKDIENRKLRRKKEIKIKYKEKCRILNKLKGIFFYDEKEGLTYSNPLLHIVNHIRYNFLGSLKHIEFMEDFQLKNDGKRQLKDYKYKDKTLGDFVW